MLKVCLTPVVIAGLLLLSSCSSSSSSKVSDPCEVAAESALNYLNQAKKYLYDYKSIDTRELDYDDPISVNSRILWGNYWQTSRNSFWVIINNQNCFTPEQVITAQRELNLIK